MTVDTSFAAATAAAPSPPTLDRALLATRAQFLVLGTLVGAWGAHIPSVKARYALGDGTLSLVLLATAAGAVLSLFFAGRIVGRFGARTAAGASAVVMSALLGVVLEYPNVVALMPAMLAFGASMSLFDVAINTEGSELESLGGRPIMSNLHGMFSVGGMTGAGLTSWMLHADVAPRMQLFGICAVSALIALVAARGMLESHAADAGGEAGNSVGNSAGNSPANSASNSDGDKGPAQAHFAWPRGLLLVIGLLIFAGMTAEGVMYDWCVLYLKQELAMPQAMAALGYAAFSGAMALSRFGGDRLRARHSERALLRFGSGLAAVSMAIVLLAAQPWVALVGFMLVGAGLAPVAPILFNAATRVPGVSRAAAIASVTSIGYSGFMIGPPLIGSIATTTSLTLALGVVVLASALLAIGARWVPEKGRGRAATG